MEGGHTHSVILSFEKESRTRIDDAVIIPSLKRDELAFFMNQKYKELIKPFAEFIFHGRFLLVAHGNILSLYDTETEQWRCHHPFEESSLKRQATEHGDSQVGGLNQTFAFQIKKKVVNVFREEADDQGTFGIGVLFQDGTFQKLRLILNK